MSLTFEWRTHAIHAWADDLPAGGWCLCPSCRAFEPSDQAMLAIRHLCEVVAQNKANQRIPYLAYHDTIFPGPEIDPPKESFLLFAPRERCYAHAINDESCARNRYYSRALGEWQKKFAKHGDSHSFEYYCDQILFRGIYPFLPSVILEDAKFYAHTGIECHMSLQVGGPAILPEYNMLVFSMAAWDSSLTCEKAVNALARALSPTNPKPWVLYLRARKKAFTIAMRMCEHNPRVYLDYRWLPESTSAFARKMENAYHKSAVMLENAAKILAKDIMANVPEQDAVLRQKEIKRALFEVAELRVMAEQQSGVNCFARFLNSGNEQYLHDGIEKLTMARRLLRQAKRRAIEAQLPKNAWYYNCVNAWLEREFCQKIANYKKAVSRRLTSLT